MTENKSDIELPWNHFYLWGSMFVVSRNFPSSLECNFVVSVIRVILIIIKQMIVYQVRRDVHSRARVTNESHEHWSPSNNDDSTVNEHYRHRLTRLTRVYNDTKNTYYTYQCQFNIEAIGIAARSLTPEFRANWYFVYSNEK